MDLGFGKRLSCGIVILNDDAELLLCHVTGQDHWDLPKGGIAPGETPLQAALRETREETSLVLDGAVLLDLGRLDYRPRRDLHLFATLMPRVDPRRLTCESHFTEHSGGRQMPEMDGFDWFAFEQIGALCTPKLAAVLCGRLDLERVLERLRETAAAPMAC
jgi:8-oxo-dGTP pyrophosphatase MutT (NUDIX family)